MWAKSMSVLAAEGWFQFATEPKARMPRAGRAGSAYEWKPKKREVIAVVAFANKVC